MRGKTIAHAFPDHRLLVMLSLLNPLLLATKLRPSVSDLNRRGTYIKDSTFFLSIEQIGAVESVKAASDIYSPVEGEIVNVNEALESEPSLINTSPEEEGM